MMTADTTATRGSGSPREKADVVPDGPGREQCDEHEQGRERRTNQRCRRQHGEAGDESAPAESNPDGQRDDGERGGGRLREPTRRVVPDTWDERGQQRTGPRHRPADQLLPESDQPPATQHRQHGAGDLQADQRVCHTERRTRRPRRIQSGNPGGSGVWFAGSKSTTPHARSASSCSQGPFDSRSSREATTPARRSRADASVPCYLSGSVDQRPGEDPAKVGEKGPSAAEHGPSLALAATRAAGPAGRLVLCFAAVTRVRVSFEKVGKRFDTRTVLAQLSGAVEPGRVLVVAGPNGSGKSTLLNILAGVIRPSRGAVRYRQDRTRSIHAARWFAHLGVAAPDMAVYDELTAVENLRFFARLRGLERRDRTLSARCSRSSAWRRASTAGTWAPTRRG